MDLAPPLSAFHLVLDSFAKQAPDQDVCTSCRTIITFLEQSKVQGNHSLAPTVETYAHGINVHCLAGEIAMADLVDKLQEAFVQAPELTPDVAYHMIRGYSKALACRADPNDTMFWLDDFETNIKGADVLKQALNQPSLVDRSVEGVDTLMGHLYLSALSVLVNTPPSLENAQKAKGMIDYLASLQMEHLPWVEHYTLTLQCWTHVNLYGDEADVVIQTLLQRFEDQHLRYWNLVSNLPVLVYQGIITLWSQVGKSKDAEQLLDHLLKLNQFERIKAVPPSRLLIMYNHILMGYFRENEITKVVNLYDQMDYSIPKNSFTYELVLKAISRLPYDAVQRATQVWEAMSRDPSVEVNSSHYGSLIATWSRSTSRQAADNALAVLDMMERQYLENPSSDDLKPHKGHYTAVISAFSRSARDPKAILKATKVFDRMKKTTQPDVLTYTSMIKTLANGRSVECALKAEELLDEMEAMVADSGNLETKPNIVSYTSTMMAWAKSGSPKGPEKAEEIMKMLEDKYEETRDIMLQPDAVAYGVLISAWSEVRRPDAGVRAQDVLNKVREIEARTGTKMLNTVMYTNVMLAHWRSNAPYSAVNATALLAEMKDRAAKHDFSCAPDTITYTTAIQAWARSTSVHKATQAWDILTEMCQAYHEGNLSVRPNRITFTAVLNACAFTSGDDSERQKAVEIALRTIQEFDRHDYDKTSPTMYATLLKVFGNQIRDRKARLNYFNVTFRRCCSEGQVDHTVVEVLKKYTPDLYHNLPRNRDQQIQLPPEWSMNIRR